MAPRNDGKAPIRGVRSQIQSSSKRAATKSKQTRRTGRCEPNAISTVPLKNSASLRQTPRSGPAAATPATAQNRWDDQSPGLAGKRRLHRVNKNGAIMRIPEAKIILITNGGRLRLARPKTR